MEVKQQKEEHGGNNESVAESVTLRLINGALDIRLSSRERHVLLRRGAKF